jgi:hypothetical protein
MSRRGFHSGLAARAFMVRAPLLLAAAMATGCASKPVVVAPAAPAAAEGISEASARTGARSSQNVALRRSVSSSFR